MKSFLFIQVLLQPYEFAVCQVSPSLKQVCEIIIGGNFKFSPFQRESLLDFVINGSYKRDFFPAKEKLDNNWMLST